MIARANQQSSYNTLKSVTQRNSRAKTFAITNAHKCGLCNGSHNIYACQTFLNQGINERIQSAKSLKLCLNCLRTRHVVKFCKSGKCKTCHRLHNTLLHINTGTENAKPNSRNARNQPTTVDAPISISSNCSTKSSQCQVLLSTAEILVIDSSNTPRLARALLDSVSQSNFITKQFAQTLNLSAQTTNVAMVCIGNS